MVHFRQALIMSCNANTELLESIFEEVQEAFPYLDEEKQIEIANNRFWEIAQWMRKFIKQSSTVTTPPATVGRGWNQDETLTDTAYQFKIFDDFYYQLFRDEF